MSSLSRKIKRLSSQVGGIASALDQYNTTCAIDKDNSAGQPQKYAVPAPT